MAFRAFPGIRRRIVATVPALDHALVGLERVSRFTLIILMAEVARHVAVLAAAGPVRVDGETIIAD